MIIGFTGTSKGMTPAQSARVEAYLRLFHQLTAVCHGDCIGADAQFHEIARRLGLRVIGHPPVDSAKRAWCIFDEWTVPSPHLNRNRQIVDKSDVLVAAPRQSVEPKSKRAGGTWYTLRYARKVGRPRVVVWPDGTLDRDDPDTPGIAHLYEAATLTYPDLGARYAERALRNRRVAAAHGELIRELLDSRPDPTSESDEPT